MNIYIRPYGKKNSEVDQNSNHLYKQIDPSDAAVVIINLPSINQPMIWESAFECNEENIVESDPFNFIQESSPPASSLIMQKQTVEDIRFSQNIRWLSGFCGKKISLKDISKRFLLEEIVTSKWPNNIPITCIKGTKA